MGLAFWRRKKGAANAAPKRATRSSIPNDDEAGGRGDPTAALRIRARRRLIGAAAQVIHLARGTGLQAREIAAGNRQVENAVLDAVEINPVLRRIALAPAGIKRLRRDPAIDELDRFQCLAFGEAADELPQARLRDPRNRVVGVPVEPSLQNQPGGIE